MRTGHHPVGHKAKSKANLSDKEWIQYWTDYYRKSKQLDKAGVDSWRATREVWMRKLVQAKRIRCQQCSKIVKLWLKNFGYGPKRFILQELPERSGKTRRS